MQDAVRDEKSAATMKLPNQILLMFVFLHLSVPQPLESEENEEEVNPLHYDYDVASQTMKKGGRNVNTVELEECKESLEDEKNVKNEISTTLEEVQQSLQEYKKNLTAEMDARKEEQLLLQNCRTKFETLQNEKDHLENIVLMQKTSQQEQKDAVSLCESNNQNLKQKTQSLESEVEKLKEEVAKWQKVSVLLCTIALGAFGVAYFIFQRFNNPPAGVPNQQDEAGQQGPQPLPENVPRQQNDAHEEDAAPRQPEHHQHDDDQANRRAEHDGESRRGIIPEHPSDHVNDILPENGVEEVPPVPPGLLPEERNVGDKDGQSDAIPPEVCYQTAAVNSEHEKSQPVPPKDD